MGIDGAIQEKLKLANLDNEHYVQEYYVDNTRSASGDGSSWDQAFLQISEAVTAWEAKRITNANVYAKGVIYVRGTGTPYSHLAALPSYCDIIGVGAVSHGNGTGIASITGFVGIVSTYDAIAGTARGLRLSNLQFIAGVGFWCADFVNLFRSEIDHCMFQSLTAACDGGMRFSGASGGLWIHDNHWGGSGLVIPIVGMQAQNQNFDHCRIERNIICGTTAGVLIDADVIYGDETVFKDNVIGDTGWGCAKGVDDNATTGRILYCGNYITATDAMELTSNGTVRAVGNHVVNTTTGAMEVANS